MSHNKLVFEIFIIFPDMIIDKTEYSIGIMDTLELRGT